MTTMITIHHNEKDISPYFVARLFNESSITKLLRSAISYIDTFMSYHPSYNQSFFESYTLHHASKTIDITQIYSDKYNNTYTFRYSIIATPSTLRKAKKYLSELSFINSK